MSIQQLAPQLASKYCIVNGAFMTLEEVENMGYDEFTYRAKINMPFKLYKYFPNKEIIDKDGNKVNYSLLALKNNTVYMQSPSLFDDVYDSDINIDYYEYHKYRLIEYCRRCGISVNEDKTTGEIGTELLKAILESVESNKDFNHIFTMPPTSQTELLSNEIFIKKVIIGLTENQDIGQVVSKIISEEYQDYIQELRNILRISCFATTPYSQLMWGGAYADCHNGFCVEYTVLPNDEKYKELYYNLFPMVYCKIRPNITKKLVECKDRDKTKEYLWNIYFNEVEYKGKRFAMFRSMVGEPLCVAQHEDIMAMGSRRLILLGNCGVLDKTIEDCGIIIPVKAIRDEGTSYHYAEPSDTIDVNYKYKNEFKDVLKEFGYPYVEGITWTTDACYRETRDKVNRRKEQGAVCVEMECAGMQALCDFRETEFFQFFYAGDNLDHSSWEPRSISGSARLDDKGKIMLLAFELGLKMMENI